MAHVEDLGNGLHRQVVLVGGPDGGVSLGSQFIGLLV
jgi:hypothetical protein